MREKSSLMNTALKKILTSIFLVLTFLLVGCAGPTEPPPSSIKALDSTVVNTTKMNLKADLELVGSQIEVVAENELLVLRGTVPTEEAKNRAEAVAKRTPRVEKVANHLEVQPVE